MTFTADYKGAIVTPSPNLWLDRQGHTPQYIVAHGTSGTFPGCLDWLCSTQSGGSVHYLVDRAGRIFQLVPESAAAWGNGIPEPPSSFLGGVNPNLITLSCEAEREPGNTSPLTSAQKVALIALFGDIRRRHGPLPLIPHSAISPLSRAHCPGDGYPLAEIDHASARPVIADTAITWTTFTGTPQRVPVVFYKDASHHTPLYPSAATKQTVLTFDAWRYGEAVVDPGTGQPDRRWFHRYNPKGHMGWCPSASILGNPAGSQP